MKTAEFKLSLSSTDEKTLEAWLTSLKWVWNRGVSLIEEFNRFNAYHKPDKQTYPCSPISTYWSRFRKSDELKGIYPSCPIGWRLQDFDDEINQLEDGKKLIYPVRTVQDGYLIRRLDFFGLQPEFTHKRNLNKPWLTAIPSKFIDGTVKSLAESWKAFQTQVGRMPPKYKKKYDSVTTLIHNNSKDIAVKGDKINIPKIGYVRVKGLDERWQKDLPFCPLKITKEPSGFYLQLTGEMPEKPAKPSDKIVAIDMGIVRFYTDDMGRHIEPPKYLKRAKTNLQKLQRKASRQYLLNKDNPDWDRKNWRKTQNKVARVHEKVRRQRKAFNHFHSSKLVNQFDTIIIENLKLKNMMKSPKPQEREDGSGFKPNGKKRKAGLNRSLSDVGIGQFFNMLETKAKAHDRTVIRENPAYGSQDCPKCNHRSADNRLTQSLFKCVQCGHEANADHNAAVNYKLRAVKKLRE